MKKIHMTNKLRVKTGCIFIVVSFVMLLLSKVSPDFAQWYSVKVYPVFIRIIGGLSGMVPFSVAEVLLYLIGLILVGSGIWMIVRKVGKEGLISWCSHTYLLVSILFFLYVMNCGVNYNRTSFAESSKIAIKEYSSKELKELCAFLTRQVNEISGQVERDQNGTMKIEGLVQKKGQKAMTRLGGEFPELSGYYAKPKGLIFPWILSVQQLSGVYSPFTVEANYNNAMPKYYIPFTICHELAHLRGFMQEEEANFISYLACVGSKDAELEYSGYLSGWVYAMNVLYMIDYEAWENLESTLLVNVQADLKANRTFWAKYDGRIAEVANKINDTYLKANGQEKGVASYDYMVDLLVAYYRES